MYNKYPPLPLVSLVNILVPLLFAVSEFFHKVGLVTVILKLRRRLVYLVVAVGALKNSFLKS